MEFFTKRSMAAAITAVVMAFSCLLGINLTFNRAAEKTQAVFYEDKGMDTQLTSAVEGARGLVTTAGDHDALTASAGLLRSAYGALLDAGTIPEKYDAYVLITDARDDFAAALAEADVSDTDRENMDYYLNKLDNALRTITWLDYNTQVSRFYAEYTGVFPMNLLKPLLFGDGPEYFGIEG